MPVYREVKKKCVEEDYGTFGEGGGSSVPECIFVREGQRVQESSVQEHQLVIDLSDLQWAEKGVIFIFLNFTLDSKGFLSRFICQVRTVDHLVHASCGLTEVGHRAFERFYKRRAGAVVSLPLRTDISNYGACLAVTHGDSQRLQLVLVQGHGGLQVVLQALSVVAAVQRQHQAVGQPDQDVPCHPGHRLVAEEP